MNLSVIIPTYNRATVLSHTLNILLNQLSHLDEVIIVDNGSLDDTKNIIQGQCGKIPIHYLYQSNRGPSYARNLGVAHAKKNCFVFLDDDCWIHPSWSKRIRSIAARDTLKRPVVHQGTIEPKFRSFGFYQHAYILQYNFEKQDQYRDLHSKQPIDFIHAGNFFMLQSLAKKYIPLFDERTFPFIGEERDLAFRLQTHGCQIVYEPSVRVDHYSEKRSGFITSLQSSHRYGRANALLRKRYETRSATARLLLREYAKRTKTKKISMFKYLFSNLHQSLYVRAKYIAYIYLKKFIFTLSDLIYTYLISF